MNTADEEFGPERIEEFINQISCDSPNEINNKVLEQVDLFRGEIAYRDDVTLLTCLVK